MSILMHKRAALRMTAGSKPRGMKKMQPGGQHPRRDREGQGRHHDGTIQPGSVL